MDTDTMANIIFGAAAGYVIYNMTKPSPELEENEQEASTSGFNKIVTAAHRKRLQDMGHVGGLDIKTNETPEQYASRIESMLNLEFGHVVQYLRQDIKDKGYLHDPKLRLFELH